MKRIKSQQSETKTFPNKEYGVFYKSSLSGAGNCVAVATFTNGEVWLRDSKDVSGRTLIFTRDEWDAFVKGVKKNEFDV